MKVYEDRQGIIWVGTGSVWDGSGGETDEGGLNRFDKETGRFSGTYTIRITNIL